LQYIERSLADRVSELSVYDRGDPMSPQKRAFTVNFVHGYWHGCHDRAPKAPRLNAASDATEKAEGL
jgi:hypothetical protein